MPQRPRPLHRLEVARILEMSESTLRRLEHELEPEVGPNGIRLFDPERVETYRIERARKNAGSSGHKDAGVSTSLADGQLAAQVFELLDAHESPVAIVQRLKVHPLVVEDLHRHWARLGGGLFLNTEDVLSLSRMRQVEYGIAKGEPMGKVLRTLLELHEPACIECGRKVGPVCPRCAERTRRAALDPSAPVAYTAPAGPQPVVHPEPPAAPAERRPVAPPMPEQERPSPHATVAPDVSASKTPTRARSTPQVAPTKGPPAADLVADMAALLDMLSRAGPTLEDGGLFAGLIAPQAPPTLELG